MVSEQKNVTKYVARPGWSGTLQNGIRAMVSTLSLDGLDRWLMKQRFQSELLSRGTKFEVQSIPECQEGTV
jgi:hypothetical protein